MNAEQNFAAANAAFAQALINANAASLVGGAPDQQPREARCAVSTGYLALAADVWISPCNMIPLYVERTPGNFDRWQGPTGRYAGEYGYPIYQKAEPDNGKAIEPRA